ncbi:multidrug effflux MFS transporter [Nocardiopsis dassonvillei]|uniref:multidrug effflux MFS transporter n=1 Tax=Nocardiopsis dassonvillei TaxID=2014 RepID=UPI00200BFA91|nr:multidrug effflux MFS transporter [Nocardiopsis dassonvillei]MCK9870326.1 multidrug effflux MFS transporter [Nocardiopsis dassonvillei]
MAVNDDAVGGAPPVEGSTAPAPVGLLILMLAALTAVAPFATDMYVPGFPEVTDDLRASASSVQLSMTAFLVGLAVGQILLGPISDSKGRRGILLGGTVLFAVFSLACALAPTIEILNVARVLQGASGAAGMVIARAVISDRFHGPDAARHFSTLAIILFIAPVLAPVVGAGVLELASWRVVFLVLAAFGALLVAGVLAWIPESLPPERRRSGGVGATFMAMGGLLSNRAVMGYVLLLAFGSAGLFTYIVSSTYVFQEIYGVSAMGYSLIFGGNAVGMVVAGVAFAALSKRMRVNNLLLVGVALALGSSALLTVLLLLTGGGLASTWACLFVLVFGIGIAFPAATTLAQSVGHESPGATSALVGGGQFILGAAAAPLAGLFGTDSTVPMAAVITVSFLLGGTALVFLARPWLGLGEPDAEEDTTDAASQEP